MKDILPPNLFRILHKSGICTPKQLLLLSLWDIKKLTNLKDEDILLVKSIVSERTCPIIISGNRIDTGLSKINTGCSNIDLLLKGGFRRGIISEIYGESGTGKTQIAIQTAAHCSASGSVYICTEDIFPVKRFNQINNAINKESNLDCGKAMFVEHITEAHDLLMCIKVRLPKLLNSQRISLIILDSIAAPFRCENNYVQRAEDLKELAMWLLKFAQTYNLSVICINQVTASFNDLETVQPSLGLVWSNMVSNRFKIMRKQQENQDTMKNISHTIRQLQIVYSPELPNEMVEFIITSNGIENVPIT